VRAALHAVRRWPGPKDSGNSSAEGKSRTQAFGPGDVDDGFRVRIHGSAGGSRRNGCRRVSRESLVVRPRLVALPQLASALASCSTIALSASLSRWLFARVDGPGPKGLSLHLRRAARLPLQPATHSAPLSRRSVKAKRAPRRAPPPSPSRGPQSERSWSVNHIKLMNSVSTSPALR
jgi:hypothetical protein